MVKKAARPASTAKSAKAAKTTRPTTTRRTTRGETSTRAKAAKAAEPTRRATTRRTIRGAAQTRATSPTRAEAKTGARPKTTRGQATRGQRPASTKSPAVGDVPSMFRINVEVGNLDEAADFYSKLFGIEGRKQAGSRCYFSCGAVTLQVVDVSRSGTPHPAAKALYFLVKDLDAIYARAQALDCLSREMVHGVAGGAISVRPWGERSFYAEDKWSNPLCFVEEGTIYPG